jgi:hypothetical protein
MLLLSDRTVAPRWLPQKMGAKTALLTISDGSVTIVDNNQGDTIPIYLNSALQNRVIGYCVPLLVFLS